MIWLSSKSLVIFSLGLFISSGSCASKPLVRDVVIIGGGSSGTYAAIRLRDQGKSVVVVERESILGGHTETYVDPTTKQVVDYGVVLFHDLPVVRQYFARLNISSALQNLSQIFQPITTYLDPDTAQTVNFTPPDPSAGLAAYAQKLAQYPGLETGYNLPNPVPEDLLLPFGQFVAKYPEVGNATFSIAQFNQGLGNILDQPTLYVFKILGFDVLNTMANGALLPTSNNNHQIYDQASRILGPDVLFRSTVASARQRDAKGVEIDVNTPNGIRTIQAKKILITIPQTLKNLLPFNPDHTEAKIFNEFRSVGYYTSLVRNTGLPSNFTSSSASANTSFNVPQMPAVYSVSATAVNGVFDVKYGSQKILPDSYVQGEILSYIQKLHNNGFTGNFSGAANFLRFKSHVPFELTVSPSRIATGFYNDLYALQGYRSTWYTGAAFHVQDSSKLWNFTETVVLPGLLKSL